MSDVVWKPLPDGVYYDVEVMGNEIGMVAVDAHGIEWPAETALPDYIRLCQALPAPDEAESLTTEEFAAIEWFVENHGTWNGNEVGAHYTGVLSKLLAKLDGQPAPTVTLDAAPGAEWEPNWEHAPLWAKYWTRDERGTLMWWENEPYRHREIGIWMDESDGKRTQGTCMALLRQRPGSARGE